MRHLAQIAKRISSNLPRSQRDALIALYEPASAGRGFAVFGLFAVLFCDLPANKMLIS